MIYIANPIYDAVFKFMMQDEAVAKRFISIIINKKIKSIKSLPQEKAYQSEHTGIIIQRLDFVAEIIEEDGKKSKVLIEIQKSNKSYHADIFRFRGYLAQQYQKDDLPIITIYILGFELKDLESPAIYVAPECKDLYYEKPIEKRPEFVEKLTHGMYVIQVPRLRPVLKSKLTQLLDLFNQTYRLSRDKPGNRVLNVPYKPNDKDISVIMKRLEKANADEELRQKIDDEEMADKVYEEIFGELDKKVLFLEKLVGNEKQRADEEKQRADEEKQRADGEKQRAEQLEKEKVQMIKFMLKNGMSIEEIQQALNIELDFLKKHNLV